MSLRLRLIVVFFLLSVVPVGAVESVIDLLRAELDRYIDEFGPPRPTVVPSAAASAAGSRS